MATARIGTASFDHGAQYLTARTSGFRAYLDELESLGYVARWTPRTREGKGGQLSPWYVGTPGMSTIVRPLAESVRIYTNRNAHTLESVDQSIRIRFDDQTYEGPYSAVAVAVPAPAARLLLGRMESLAKSIAQVRMSPCWALMVRFDEVTLPDQDVFSDMSEVVRWIARNNTKPNRNARGETIVVHASPQWSREAEDAEPDEDHRQRRRKPDHRRRRSHPGRGHRGPRPSVEIGRRPDAALDIRPHRTGLTRPGDSFPRSRTRQAAGGRW